MIEHGSLEELFVLPREKDEGATTGDTMVDVWYSGDTMVDVWYSGDTMVDVWCSGDTMVDIWLLIVTGLNRSSAGEPAL